MDLIEINEKIEKSLNYRVLRFSILSANVVLNVLEENSFQYKIVKSEGLFELYLEPKDVDRFYVLYEQELFQ